MPPTPSSLVLQPSLLIDLLSKLSWGFRHVHFCSESCMMGSPYPCPCWLAGASLTGRCVWAALGRLRATALDCQVNSEKALVAHMKLGYGDREDTIHATVITECLDLYPCLHCTKDMKTKALIEVWNFSPKPHSRKGEGIEDSINNGQWLQWICACYETSIENHWTTRLQELWSRWYSPRDMRSTTPFLAAHLYPLEQPWQ